MNMPTPYYLFTPLDQHFDYGLGSMADGFMSASDKLDPVETQSNEHLAALFLRRHAVELYLKSVILIFHKVLGEALGETRIEKWMSIEIDGKMVPFHRIHSIEKLYRYLSEFIAKRRGELSQHGDVEFIELEAEYDEWVEIVEREDANGTFLRYPDVFKRADDNRKSAYLSIEPSSIPKPHERGQPTVSLVVLNENEEVVDAYQSQHKILTEFHQTLAKLASMLHQLHYGVRMTLTHGR